VPLTKWTEEKGKVVSAYCGLQTFTQQPMDQGTIATFKAYYIRKTFEEAMTIVNKVQQT
jgi:hypothetical protein